MKNAVIYARFSSDKQTEQTIENQIRICSNFAKDNQLNVVKIYADRGKSGRSDNRPEFQHMLADMEKREFQVIIVYMLDRFMRNTYLALTTEHLLQEYGVELVSVCEPIVQDETGVSNVIKFILSWKAEEFSRTLSRRMKDAHKNVLLKGNFVGGGLPLGYTVVDKRIVVDETGADIVRFIFDQYARGVPKKEIASEVFKRWGKKIHYNSMTYYIKNKKYIGITEYNGEEYTNVYPAIIDKKLFLEAQKHMVKKKQKPALGATKTEYLLAGKAYCAKCGSPLICESGKSHTGTMHYYYACAAHKKDKSCDMKNIKRDKLEQQVVDISKNYVLNPAYYTQYIDQLLAEYNSKYDTQKYLDNLKKQASTIEQKMTKLTDAFIDAERRSALAQKIKTEMGELEVAKYQIQDEIEAIEKVLQVKMTKEYLVSMFEEISAHPEAPDFAKSLITLFIDKVFVDDETITISYKLDGSENVTLEKIKKGSNLNQSGDSGGTRTRVTTVKG